jgi:hypothetical protein
LDQDILFGPAEAAVCSSYSAKLEKVEAELARVQAKLLKEREQSQLTESAYKTQLAKKDACYEEAAQAVTAAQAETNNIKRGDLCSSFCLSGCFFLYR